MKTKKEDHASEEKIIKSKAIIIGKFIITTSYRISVTAHPLGREGIIAHGTIAPIEIEISNMTKKKDTRKIIFDQQAPTPPTS